MRQERIQKRPLRRQSGGGSSPDPLAPVPARPDSAKRAMQKTDELLRRLDRMLHHSG